jgi:hypothetical protein
MINNFLKQFNKNKFTFIVIICFFLPFISHAATLSISPSSTNISTNNILTVKVVVDTGGKYINNADATIQFSTDLLEVVSISKNSSVFSLWVEEPSFSNYTGKITFNGGAATPGFIGSSGTVASITFKAKKEGTASILFTDAFVRENDGLGTNILTSKNSGSIKIENAKTEIPKTETPKSEIPKKEIIKKVEKPVISKEIINNIETSKDTLPSVQIENGQILAYLNNDASSNIDYYIIQIDDNSSFKVIKEELTDGHYIIPPQAEGGHTMSIIGFDNKGKYTKSTLNFISPPISIPILSLNSSEITNGEDFVIFGQTNYPYKQVEVILEIDGKEIKRYTQTTSLDGSFSIITDKIEEIGLVTISANVVLSDTIKSSVSEKIFLKVNEIPFIKVTSAIIPPLIYTIIIAILFIILILLIYIGWHRFFGLKNKINKELEITKTDVHKAMLLLKEELNNQLETLEKVKEDRILNKKEEAIFNEIEKNINDIDSFIQKKFKKIM